MALKPLKTLNFGGEDTYYLAPEWKNIAETTVKGDTLTWDGNTDGLESGSVTGFGDFYLVQDKVYTLEDFTNGGSYTQVITDDKVQTFTRDNITDLGGGVLTNPTNATFRCVPVDNFEADGMSFPKKGVYFKKSSTNYLTSFTINGYTKTTPLPNKYLDFIETVSPDTLTWDGDTTGKDYAMGLCKVSDVVPTAEDFANGGTVKFVESSASTIEFVIGSNIVYMDISAQFGVEAYGLISSVTGNYPLVAIVPNDCTLSGMSVKKGLYFTKNDNGGAYTSSLTLNGFTGFAREQIKEEYVKDVILAVLEEKGLLS